MSFTNIKLSLPEWQHRLNILAKHFSLHSVLIMESKVDSMVVVAANEQIIYNVGDSGPKSKQSGCHELYCERVVDTAKILLVPDANIDDEWKGNEDYVKFNLGTYLGFPLIHRDVVVGTICALHNKPFDFKGDSPSAYNELEQLRTDIQLTF